ncbi:Uncharacterised protein [Mycobacteroides abscessus subsp. abscessus]|nr:Uncharacterised protein [Mycobacteroides abscessus subsp. abscessus]
MTRRLQRDAQGSAHSTGGDDSDGQPGRPQAVERTVGLVVDWAIDTAIDRESLRHAERDTSQTRYVPVLPCRYRTVTSRVVLRLRYRQRREPLDCSL